MDQPLESVCDLSSLTRTQAETLEMHHRVRESQINMETALKMRKVTGIRRGTHYRILAQARRNVKQSLFTVAVAVRLGLLKAEDVQRLIVSISAIPEGIDPDRLAEVIRLAELLADRIVTS